MAPPLVTAEDLAAWTGQEIASSTGLARAEAILAAASALVRSYTGQTWTTETGALDTVPDNVATVTLSAASRVWFNPSSATSKTAGPFSEGFGDAGLRLTDDEKAMLDEFRDTDKPALWTLATTRAATAADNAAVNDWETNTGFEGTFDIPSREPW